MAIAMLASPLLHPLTEPGNESFRVSWLLASSAHPWLEKESCAFSDASRSMEITLHMPCPHTGLFLA